LFFFFPLDRTRAAHVTRNIHLILKKHNALTTVQLLCELSLVVVAYPAHPHGYETVLVATDTEMAQHHAPPWLARRLRGGACRGESSCLSSAGRFRPTSLWDDCQTCSHCPRDLSANATVVPARAPSISRWRGPIAAGASASKGTTAHCTFLATTLGHLVSRTPCWASRKFTRLVAVGLAALVPQVRARRFRKTLYFSRAFLFHVLLGRVPDASHPSGSCASRRSAS